MENIFVNFKEDCGSMKPMHAVNNGPVYKFAPDQRITNIDDYKLAGIPYARTHDASYNPVYGGEHTVDVDFIFPDFDADPEVEASYDFDITDEYLKVIDFAGTKIFYRLGSKIEHWKKKYNTLPPKDFKKWAVICEHIIRHYNYGWANGFHYNIEYWEIWNEPDLDPDDSQNKRTWGGTQKQFFELYQTAAVHLKKCFPELKIGGPALCGGCEEWADEFLKQLDAPLDFLSWHIYANAPEVIVNRAESIRNMLDKYGYENTESILDEWNYIKGWEGEEWLYSLRNEKGIKGAAFTAATMILSQYSSVDMLMYYDARPCVMNGLFSTDFVCDRLKGYYPFPMFNTLYRLGICVKTESDSEHLYVCAARNETNGAVMLAYFDDNDEAQKEKTVNVSITGFSDGSQAGLRYFMLDNNNDCTLFREETFHSDAFGSILKLQLDSVVLIELNKSDIR